LKDPHMQPTNKCPSKLLCHHPYAKLNGIPTLLL
jgi:hypothetical protein